MQSKTGVSYYVQLSDGDVHRVSLDQLDEGFQAGHIDESTMVLADGASKWVRLGELAGIDDDVPVEIEPYAAPMPASVAFPAYAPRVVAPAYPSAAPRSLALASPILPSHRPVSIDLGEVDPFRQGSGRRWFAALVAIAVIGGLGTVAVKRPALAQTYLGRIGIHLPGAKPVSAAPPVAAAAQVVAPPPPAASPPPPAAAPPPLIVTTAAAALLESTASPADARRAGGSKDKTPRMHAPTAAPAHPFAPKKARTTSFVTTGGGKYDPLGSNI